MAKNKKKKAAAKKAPAKKKAASKKKAAAKATTRGAVTGPRGMDTEKSKITFVAKPNPKREGTASHERYAKYRKGMSIAAALAAGVTSADMKYDLDRDYIQIKVVSK